MASWKTPEVKGRRSQAVDTPAELRLLEAAAKDTPLRLRNLEAGWRQRRRTSLAVKQTTPVKERSADVPADVEKSLKAALLPPSRRALITTHRLDNSTSFQPILAHPLPQGTHRLSPNAQLIVPDVSASEEMTILVLTKRITIQRGGRSLSSDQLQNGKDRAASLKLDLDLSKLWSREEAEEWTLVSELVAKAKSRLPTMKLYLPRGHLTLMSNSPPDLLLCLPLTYPTSSSSALTGSLRIKYSRQTELFRSSLHLTYRGEGERESDWIHVNRQLAIPHLTPNNQQEDSKILEVSSSHGPAKLSRLEASGLRQIEDLRSLWETAERQLYTHT